MKRVSLQYTVVLLRKRVPVNIVLMKRRVPFTVCWWRGGRFPFVECFWGGDFPTTVAEEEKDFLPYSDAEEEGSLH
jgi:hypothetical protein